MSIFILSCLTNVTFGTGKKIYKDHTPKFSTQMLII